MPHKTYLAIDLGASSGRHIAGRLQGDQLSLQVLHRFENGPVTVHGHMHWDVLGIWREILNGLRVARTEATGEITSIGVDTWGVDFGLIGPGDELLGNPYNYRDSRTVGMIEQAAKIVPKAEIFAETGLQFMELNTLYQLLSMKLTAAPMLDAAESMLMMPDLFHWMLCGNRANERTEASTSQLFNPQTGRWSTKLIEAFGLPEKIFGPIVEPGTRLGRLLPEVASETGLTDVEVVLPGTHDTASAVLAVPATAAPSAQPDWCYISSGTWSLMGVEVPEPVVTERCSALNFTNEGGVGGTTRLLKNIPGLWLVQECRRIWNQQGHTYNWEGLARAAAEATPLLAVIDPEDPRLVAPDNMPATIAELCRESGQRVPETDGAIIRCALESLAMKYRQTLTSLEELTGGRIETIHIVGGGSQHELLCQMAADACQRPVVAGPVEATAIGNLLMQAVSAGDFSSIAEARQVVVASFDVKRYEPTTQWSV